MSLSPKQDRFCREYVIDFNGAQAYIRAGYSPKGANGMASRLLSKASIKARVAELTAEVNKRLDFDADWIREQMRDQHDHCLAKMQSDDINSLGYSQLRTKTLDMMSKVESMQTQRHELDGRSQVTFNIKTGRKK